MHGELDNVMSINLTNEIEQRLLNLGAQVTVDRFPKLRHGIDLDVVGAISRRLAESGINAPGTQTLQ